MRRTRYGIPMVFALLALTVIGCAMRQSGYKIADETIAFIQPGATTRAEVIENLGPPLLEFRDVRVSAYSWGKMRPTGGTPAVREPGLYDRQMRYGVTPAPFEDRGLVEARRWICCIAWDENDRVKRVERVEVESATSLEQAVRRWAGGAAQ